MTDPTPSRPLWRVMVAASVQALFDTSNGDTPVVNCRLAAEIRALAKWVEERTAVTTAFDPDDMPVVWRIAGMLLAEADCAEAGE